MTIDKIVILLQNALNSNHTFEFPINGTSMKPLLKKGDFVELDKPLNIKKGDIIFYKRNDGTYVLHRIIKEKKGYYVLRGDHQLKKEEPIYKEQIIAKVISVKGKSTKRFSYKMYLLTLKLFVFRFLYSKM